jgi:hypothetical protein
LRLDCTQLLVKLVELFHQIVVFLMFLFSWHPDGYRVVIFK